MEDEIYDLQDLSIVIAHNLINQHILTLIISQREYKKCVFKYLEHYQAGLQVTASLEEFSDLSDAEE